MNYFDLPHVSNSDFTELLLSINGKDRPENLQKLFNFGHLIDSVTGGEENKLEEQSGILKHESGILTFEQEDIERAMLMKLAYDADPLLQRAFLGAKNQYWFVRERFKVEYEGFEFFLRAKCKFDKYKKGMGGEIKSTAAKNQKEFEAQSEILNYDRACAWYMDLANEDRYILAGLSKHRNKHTKKHEVYKVAVRRGDEFYNRGKAKYQAVAYKYYTLISSFDFNAI